MIYENIRINSKLAKTSNIISRINSNSHAQGGLIGDAYETTISFSYANSTFANSHYTQSGFISVVGSGVQLNHVYSTSKDVNGNYVRFSYNSNVNQTVFQSAYTITSGNGQLKTLEEILVIIESVYPSIIWDFVNRDQLGNPTLKFLS